MENKTQWSKLFAPDTKLENNISQQSNILYKECGRWGFLIPVTKLKEKYGHSLFGYTSLFFGYTSGLNIDHTDAAALSLYVHLFFFFFQSPTLLL